MQPIINIYTGIDGLALAKKAELAARVEELAKEELCDCCKAALQASANGVEEFYNQCHADDGTFCGGGTASRGIKGKNRGPGTHRPAPIDYYKDRVRNKIESIKQRKQSKEYKKLTVGPVYGTLTSAIWGNVKIKKLQKTDLKDLSTGDLVTLRNKLKSDQRFYNTYVERTAAFSNVPGIAASAAVASWKTKNIPTQITRVDKEVKTRFDNIRKNPHGKGFEIENIEELQLDGLVAAGEFKQPPTAIINLVADFIARLDDDDDVSADDKKKIMSSLK